MGDGASCGSPILEKETKLDLSKASWLIGDGQKHGLDATSGNRPMYITKGVIYITFLKYGFYDLT